MRYYINKRTGVVASKSLWSSTLMVFCETDGRKDFNLRMDSLEAEYFLKDPDTKQVSQIDAETFAILRSPSFTDPASSLLDEFLSAEEATAKDWKTCVDDAAIDAIMNEQDWREIWLNPERVELAQEIALAKHSDITAWLEKNDYILSDADKIRLIVATHCFEMEDAINSETKEKEDGDEDNDGADDDDEEEEEEEGTSKSR